MTLVIRFPKAIAEVLHKMNKNITIFRGCSMIMIVLCHYAQGFPGLPAPVKFLLSLGQMGCQVFFIMSAYACFLSIEKKGYHTGTFLKRRLSKVVPPYWGGIIIYQIIFLLGILPFQARIIPITFNVLLLHGFIPDLAIMNRVVLGGWFMGAIVIFYLLSMPLFSLNKRLSQKLKTGWDGLLLPTICLVLTLLIYIPVLVMDLMENNSVWYFCFINQLSTYLFGAALFNVLGNAGANKVKLPILKGLCALSLFLVFWILDLGISWILVPYLFSMFVYYLFIWVNSRKQEYKPSFMITLMEKISGHSINIYMTHPILVYSSFVTILAGFAGKIPVLINRIFHVNCYFSDLALLLVLLPFVLVSCYFAAFLFSKIIKPLELLVSRLIRQT